MTLGAAAFGLGALDEAPACLQGCIDAAGNELGERRWKERAAIEAGELAQVRRQTRRQVEAFLAAR